MRAAAEKSNAVILANRDASADSRKALLAERDRQASTIKTLSDNQADLNGLYAKAFTDAQAKSAAAAKLQANIDQLLNEKRNADEKLAAQLKTLNDQSLEVARARAAQTAAELETRALRAQNESQRATIASLQQQREGRGGVGGNSAPAPEGFRASITQYDPQRMFAAINAGLDSKIVRGTRLTVQRIDNGGGKYLGTLTITEVDPKVAVGTFTPAAGQARNPETYPRPNDLVVPYN